VKDCYKSEEAPKFLDPSLEMTKHYARPSSSTLGGLENRFVDTGEVLERSGRNPSRAFKDSGRGRPY
jgi:hypothetical protein